MKKIDWDKVKKFVKKKNFIMTVCVFVLTILSIGISYASFFSVKSNESNQSITTGTLEVSYSSSSSTAVTNLTSMSDELGMEQEDASVIYIQNDGSLSSTYVLTIGYDVESFESVTASSATLTPIDYIMFAIYEYDTSDYTETLIAGPYSIADLPIYSYDSSDSNNNRYLVLFDTLGSNTSSNSTITYKIKTWLSDQAIPAVSYTYFYVNTEVVAEVSGAKMAYNLSGTLTDGTSALSGATISIQNGSFSTTTGSSGTFTLSGLYSGTYNVDITYDNVTYSGNLTVVEEDGSTTASIESLGTTFSGTDIYNVANTYGTTISKIIDINGISTYSSEASIDSGSLYPTYRFTGGLDEDVSGITIILDTTNTSFTMSL